MSHEAYLRSVFREEFYGEQTWADGELVQYRYRIGQFRIETSNLPDKQLEYAFTKIRQLSSVPCINWTYRPTSSWTCRPTSSWTYRPTSSWTYYRYLSLNYSIIHIYTATDRELVDAVCKLAFSGYESLVIELAKI